MYFIQCFFVYFTFFSSIFSYSNASTNCYLSEVQKDLANIAQKLQNATLETQRRENELENFDRNLWNWLVHCQSAPQILADMSEGLITNIEALIEQSQIQDKIKEISKKIDMNEKRLHIFECDQENIHSQYFIKKLRESIQVQLQILDEKLSSYNSCNCTSAQVIGEISKPLDILFLDIESLYNFISFLRKSQEFIHLKEYFYYISSYRIKISTKCQTVWSPHVFWCPERNQKSLFDQIFSKIIPEQIQKNGGQGSSILSKGTDQSITSSSPGVSASSSPGDSASSSPGDSPFTSFLSPISPTGNQDASMDIPPVLFPDNLETQFNNLLAQIKFGNNEYFDPELSKDFTLHNPDLIEYDILRSFFVKMRGIKGQCNLDEKLQDLPLPILIKYKNYKKRWYDISESMLKYSNQEPQSSYFSTETDKFLDCNFSIGSFEKTFQRLKKESERLYISNQHFVKQGEVYSKEFLLEQVRSINLYFLENLDIYAKLWSLKENLSEYLYNIKFVLSDVDGVVEKVGECYSHIIYDDLYVLYSVLKDDKSSLFADFSQQLIKDLTLRLTPEELKELEAKRVPLEKNLHALETERVSLEKTSYDLFMPKVQNLKIIKYQLGLWNLGDDNLANVNQPWTSEAHENSKFRFIQSLCEYYCCIFFDSTPNTSSRQDDKNFLVQILRLRFIERLLIHCEKALFSRLDVIWVKEQLNKLEVPTSFRSSVTSVSNPFVQETQKKATQHTTSSFSTESSGESESSARGVGTAGGNPVTSKSTKGVKNTARRSAK